MKEVQAQRVYTTLASSPPVVASSHIGGDKEGMDLSWYAALTASHLIC